MSAKSSFSRHRFFLTKSKPHFLPDSRSVSFVQEHVIAFFYIKSFVEFGHVAERPQDPEPSERMNIFFGAADDFLVADVLSP
jgi:hypothetical protein